MIYHTNQLSTDRPFVSTGRSFVSTDRSNTPNVSAASTSTGANADESSFVYLGGKIPIDAYSLPNADLPIDPNMPDLEDVTDTLPNDGIFNGAYDDDEDVWILVDLPFGKKEIGIKWVFRNKKDERSIVVKNKARLVAQVYVDDIIFGSTKKSMCTELEEVMHKRFQSSMGELTFFLGLQVKQQPDGIFISQDRAAMDQDTMADMNMPANDVPAEQAPAIAPPTRTDDQILPSSKWVPIGKSNCLLDVHKSQRNPILPIAVALLKNTNLFRAFTASSTIPAIYIQQFWDTMCFNSSTGLYNCQLDEQWFNLHKDILRDALDITPTNDDNPFVAPPSSDTVLEYVNTLGYPSTLRNESTMSVNALYQPWRAIMSMINMCLIGKTTVYDRPRHPVLQILWGIIHSSNIDYAERIWEEYVGRDGRKIFAMPIPDALLTDEIKGAPYFSGYLEHVAEYQRYLDEEHDKVEKEEAAIESPKATKVTKPKAAKVTKPAVKETPDEPSPAKRSKGGLVGKRRKPKSPLRLVDEPSDEGVPVEEPAYNEEEANIQRALELSLQDQGERTQGPARPVVIREPDSGRLQPLPEVQGKGKEKVVEEQSAHDLLTLWTPKKKSLADQFIFQRRTPMPTEASRHAESPSLDVELALTDSEMESDNEVPKINTGDQDEGQAGPNPGNQDEGQAGPNPGDQDEGQAGSNPGDATESQPQSSHVENLKLPTEDQFFMEKPQEEELGKTNAEVEVQSMVSVPIHQDTSSVPPMTTLVIDLTKSQSDSPFPTSTATISTITTKTTTLLPPPPQLQ
ncbi:retrovirus-related pol polyprotein from transposon TNT 1-94 [Tanacetum coccineum]